MRVAASLAVLLASSIASAAGAIPDFAKVGVKADKRYAKRARLVRHPSLYESAADARPLNASDGGGILTTLTVVSDDPKASPRRPRVLCEPSAPEAPPYRVALYLDSAALGTVSAHATVITSTTTSAPGASTPGLHLRPGVLLEVLDAASGKVHFKQQGLDMTGFVPPADLDVVYTPTRNSKWVCNGTVAGDKLELLEAPGGKALVTISDDGDGYSVKRLGKPKDGFQLVAYSMDPDNDVVAVGWIAAAQVVPEKPFSNMWGTGAGYGSGVPGSPSVDLPRGSLLVGTSSGEVLGVVLEPITLACLKSCYDDGDPEVRLQACGETITVRARLPRGHK